jgi:nucleoside-diphosphate-sugar epimerase
MYSGGNVVHSRGDPSKAEEGFGFEAKTSLEAGMKATWEWMQKNENFYQH